jgi:putative ABC transport system substrate-binding protein
MKRRRFLLTLLAAALAAPLAVAAQPAGTHSRIGYLSSHSPETFRIEAFRQRLRELGLFEGRNLTITYRSADGKFDRLPMLAAELVRLKVDVIVAVPTVSAVAAKRATRTIPIVFTHVSDPVGSGLVPALARPRGGPGDPGAGRAAVSALGGRSAGEGPVMERQS